MLVSNYVLITYVTLTLCYHTGTRLGAGPEPDFLNCLSSSGPFPEDVNTGLQSTLVNRVGHRDNGAHNRRSRPSAIINTSRPNALRALGRLARFACGMEFI